MFTLVGGGMKSLSASKRSMKSVLPASAKWLKDSVVEFEPEKNIVRTAKNDRIEYDVMVVAMGLELNFDKIPGLVEALSDKDSGVSSNYSPKYVNRTYENLKKFKEGNAIFTFPASPVKCPGAPQKAVYISEHYLRKVRTGIACNISLIIQMFHFFYLFSLDRQER